jgi:hypothetical protein
VPGSHHNDIHDAVLKLIRTRADLSRWSAANAHGGQMLEAVELLRAANDSEAPEAMLPIVEKAIAAAVRVILRADDSSGIIGSAIHELLDLHAYLAPKARPAPAKLVGWMIKFQFDGRQDFFYLDVAQYASALGPRGLKLYRAKLAEIADGLGPSLPEEKKRALWADPTKRGAWEAALSDDRVRHVLDHNARRLAVVDRDVQAIIATHVRDRRVAAWLQEAAEALEEIGESDLAIEWAKRATDFDDGRQAAKAAGYWCDLLARHRPDDELVARLEVFRRWPSSSTAGQLHRAAGTAWPAHRDEVLDTLAKSPRDAVIFAMDHLGDVVLAWTLAHNLGLIDKQTWGRLADAYETLDPIGVLPVLTGLVRADLVDTDARAYKHAARRLRRMRRLAAGTDKATKVDDLIASLREEYRRRPRLQQEFDQVGLP